MATRLVSNRGSLTTLKFDSLEELQGWAKENVKNPYVLDLILNGPSKPVKKDILTENYDHIDDLLE